MGLNIRDYTDILQTWSEEHHPAHTGSPDSEPTGYIGFRGTGTVRNEVLILGLQGDVVDIRPTWL